MFRAATLRCSRRLASTSCTASALATRKVHAQGSGPSALDRVSDLSTAQILTGAAERKQKVLRAREALLGWARSSGQAADYVDNVPAQCVHQLFGPTRTALALES